MGHPNYRQEPTRADKRHFVYYFTNLQFEKLFYRFLDIQYLLKYNFEADIYQIMYRLNSDSWPHIINYRQEKVKSSRTPTRSF